MHVFAGGGENIMLVSPLRSDVVKRRGSVHGLVGAGPGHGRELLDLLPPDGRLQFFFFF